MIELCCALERWCDVFLPQRDGDLVPRLIQQGLAQEEAYRVVFDRDVAALKACDAVVINLDGCVVDEGAAFELGFAHALGKHCVGYRTDVRVLLPWGLNPMITVPLSETFTCIEALESLGKGTSRGALRSKAAHSQIATHGPCLAQDRHWWPQCAPPRTRSVSFTRICAKAGSILELKWNRAREPLDQERPGSRRAAAPAAGGTAPPVAAGRTPGDHRGCGAGGPTDCPVRHPGRSPSPWGAHPQRGC